MDGSTIDAVQEESSDAGQGTVNKECIPNLVLTYQLSINTIYGGISCDQYDMI